MLSNFKFKGTNGSNAEEKSNKILPKGNKGYYVNQLLFKVS